MCYSENKLNGIKHETISSMKFKKLKLIKAMDKERHDIFTCR